MNARVVVSRMPAHEDKTHAVLEETLPQSLELETWLKGLAEACGLQVEGVYPLIFDYREDSVPFDWSMDYQNVLLSDDHVLGCCFPNTSPSYIVIYLRNCFRCSARLGIDALALIQKVCIHELAHLAMFNGLMSVESDLYAWDNTLNNDRDLVEHLAQMATFAFLFNSKQEKIIAATERLFTKQASCYRTWEIWRDLQRYSERKPPMGLGDQTRLNAYTLHRELKRQLSWMLSECISRDNSIDIVDY
jgi:hypothetical protein